MTEVSRFLKLFSKNDLLEWFWDIAHQIYLWYRRQLDEKNAIGVLHLFLHLKVRVRERDGEKDQYSIC